VKAGVRIGCSSVIPAKAGIQRPRRLGDVQTSGNDFLAELGLRENQGASPNQRTLSVF
jgi:hypothetical protein